MKTLKISEQKARELYKKGSKEFKIILEESFGKDFFPQKITDRIRNYKDACNELCVSPIDEDKLIKLGLTKNDVAYQKIATIVRALNEDWMPNVCDSKVFRWYPLFTHDNSSSSFIFLHSCYEHSRVVAGGGSRLCLKNEELSNYCGKQFLGLWKECII